LGATKKFKKFEGALPLNAPTRGYGSGA